MPPDTTARVDVRKQSEPPLLRFDRVERTLHWVNATLFGILMLTGAALYAGPISALVGNREVVRTLHVYSGILLPVPLLLAVLGRTGERVSAPTSVGSTVGRATTPAGSAAATATRSHWASSTPVRSSTPRSSPAPRW